MGQSLNYTNIKQEMSFGVIHVLNQNKTSQPHRLMNEPVGLTKCLYFKYCRRNIKVNNNRAGIN